MLISQFIKKIRSQSNIPKTKFYQDIMAKKTYEQFENYNNETKMRLNHLPLIAERLDISTKELIHYGLDSFKNRYEQIYDSFVPLLNAYFSAEDSIEKEKIEKEITELYHFSCGHKHENICIFALYILIKSSMNQYIEQITTPDSTDLADIKQIWKNKHFYSIYDYRILGNLCIFFYYKDLKSTIELLYPLSENCSATVIEAAFTTLENLLLGEIKHNNMINAMEVLNITHNTLVQHPSYKHHLIYLQFADLIRYLQTLEPKFLFSTWNYIQIIAQADPQVNLEEQKKALNDIVKEQTGSTPQITGLLEIGENFSSSLEKPTDKITYFKIEES